MGEARQTEALFSLRSARVDDLALLNAYNAAERMDHLSDERGVTVAVNEEDVPVGYVRIVRGANGIAHVYPIVVYELWRGYGVGAALMEEALGREGELRLIARGSSRGFYERLGFEPIDFDAVDTAVTEDCGGCPHRDECQPQPMRGVARR